MSDTIDISPGNLFPVVESLSPRLAWMRAHGLETKAFESGGEECPETGDMIPHWVCFVKCVDHGRSHYHSREIAGGDTEEEACAELGRRRGLKLWNER